MRWVSIASRRMRRPVVEVVLPDRGVPLGRAALEHLAAPDVVDEHVEVAVVARRSARRAPRPGRVRDGRPATAMPVPPSSRDELGGLLDRLGAVVVGARACRSCWSDRCTRPSRRPRRARRRCRARRRASRRRRRRRGRAARRDRATTPSIEIQAERAAPQVKDASVAASHPLPVDDHAQPGRRRRLDVAVVGDPVRVLDAELVRLAAGTGSSNMPVAPYPGRGAGWPPGSACSPSSAARPTGRRPRPGATSLRDGVKPPAT